MVVAYGGVVWERDANGQLKIVAVHRPRYDDWSLPKGKAEPGEPPEYTAIREVKEETGLSCELVQYLGEISYPLGFGRTKRVGYWSMRATDRHIHPADAEVDAVEWWTPEQARTGLSYDRDREILERWLSEIG